MIFRVWHCLKSWMLNGKAVSASFNCSFLTISLNSWHSINIWEQLAYFVLYALMLMAYLK